MSCMNPSKKRQNKGIKRTNLRNKRNKIYNRYVEYHGILTERYAKSLSKARKTGRYLEVSESFYVKSCSLQAELDTELSKIDNELDIVNCEIEIMAENGR